MEVRALSTCSGQRRLCVSLLLYQTRLGPTLRKRSWATVEPCHSAFSFRWARYSSRADGMRSNPNPDDLLAAPHGQATPPLLRCPPGPCPITLAASAAFLPGPCGGGGGGGGGIFMRRSPQSAGPFISGIENAAAAAPVQCVAPRDRRARTVVIERNRCLRRAVIGCPDRVSITESGQ